MCALDGGMVLSSVRLGDFHGYFVREGRGEESGKCAEGSGQDVQLAITRKGCALQTQKGWTGDGNRGFVDVMFYVLIVDYCYEPKYASKTCFATLNPSSVRM